MAKSISRKLLPKELIFVEAYCGECGFNAAQASVIAKYAVASAATTGYKLLQRPRIRKAIKKRLDKRKSTFWITEEDILKGLHHEATATGEGTSASARVSAWVQIGKHMGMFHDKKEIKNNDVTYQVINYNSTNDNIAAIKTEAVAALDHISDKEVSIAEKSILDGVVITSFSEDEIIK